MDSARGYSPFGLGPAGLPPLESPCQSPGPRAPGSWEQRQVAAGSRAGDMKGLPRPRRIVTVSLGHWKCRDDSWACSLSSEGWARINSLLMGL